METLFDTTVHSLISPFTQIPLEDFQSTFFWALIIGFILAFTLGFGMGANDVSNAFGTSVGSKVLTLYQAYILASIFETLGAVLVGYNVTDTMRKGVVDISLYNNTPSEFLLGQIAILGGGSCWLLLATAFKMPVSTTHSIMGATLGFTLMMRGTDGIQWKKVGKIAASWVISPFFSGIISIMLYMIVDFSVLRREKPFKCGLKALPIFYFFCIAFNIFAVSYQGSKLIGLSKIPLNIAIGFSIFVGILSGLIVHFVVSPRLVKWLNEKHLTLPMAEINTTGMSATKTIKMPETKKKSMNGFGSKIQDVSATNEMEKVNKGLNTRKQSFSSLTPKGFLNWFLPYKHRQEDEKTLKMFSSIQVFTACFAGFAHGANDVSNAIAPLTALYTMYNNMDTTQKNQTPIYILLYGVVGICFGLWLMGNRVMKTVGQNMSKIHPASGFTIEFGAAMTTLIASKLGLPISTTHCLIGSIVGVGCVKSGESIDWNIFAGIAISWIVTLPISGVLSALLMYILKFTLL